MIKSKKNSSDSHLLNSFPYNALWAKGRRFFLSKLSWRFSRTIELLPKANDEIMVGYESSWPDSYKKLH